MSLKDYEVLQQLGDGAYSVVFKVRRLSDQSIYALKKVRILKLKEKEKRNALNEVRFLASIKHPNIISYKEAFFDESSQSLCLVMEYADGGDLLERIKLYQKKGMYMSESFLWSMSLQLARGLKCLHDLDIVHRDLKSANVFLTAAGGVKLGDMNVSKIAKECLLHTQTGTPYYASPEVWKDLPYDSRSDLWSLGCVIYEAACLKPPFRAEDMQGLYKKVVKGEYPGIPKTFSQDFAAVIEGLIQLNPNKRLRCGQIISMPAVARHIKIVDEQEEPNELLKTIEFPQHVATFADQLPRPKFEDTPPQRNKSGLPKLKAISKQIAGREKSEPPMHASHSSNDRSSDKSLYYLKYYREMILKENYGALRIPKLRYHYSKHNDASRIERESSVPRVRSEKVTRKQGTNKSLLLKLEQKLLENS
jgi:NIMA (never in mitosis gene a)-related kinase 1/4/5